jgi:predicted ATPase
MLDVSDKSLETNLRFETKIKAVGFSGFFVERETLKTLPTRKILFDRKHRQVSVYDPEREELGRNPSLARKSREEEEILLTSDAWVLPEPILLADILRGWSVYHDVRVDKDAILRQAAVARFETNLELDGQNLTPVLHTLYTGNRGFKKDVDSAMRAAFGEDYEELVFPPAADQRVQLRVRWRSLKTEQSAVNLSDGTLRFLILLAILANPKPPPLIAIDEPETGLHPGMLPLIAELAADAAERTQVVLSTHSPQLLDAFQGEAITTTVAQMVDGETRLTTLDGEELRRWLREYSLGSLFRSGELESLA